MSNLEERWSAVDLYEGYMGRWSREVAPRFLAALPFIPDWHWLDLGCGTGALTQAITANVQPTRVTAFDPSLNFVDFARAGTPDARFLVADGTAFPFADERFDAVVSGLVLNFIPQPERAVSEMRRVVRSGGLVATYVWDYLDGMQFLRHFWDVALALDPSAQPYHEGHRFTICNPEPLRHLWEDAGLIDVHVSAIEIPTHFDDFDAYWQPFTRGAFPAPRYLATLDDADQDALRERVRASVPTGPKGEIHLTARVFSVQGTTTDS